MTVRPLWILASGSWLLASGKSGSCAARPQRAFPTGSGSGEFLKKLGQRPADAIGITGLLLFVHERQWSGHAEDREKAPLRDGLAVLRTRFKIDRSGGHYYPTFVAWPDEWRQ